MEIHNFKFDQNAIRDPHVDFGGDFPKEGTEFFVGPAYVGGKNDKAIMRDLLNNDGLPTGYHITVYYEQQNGKNANYKLANYSK